MRVQVEFVSANLPALHVGTDAAPLRRSGQLLSAVGFSVHKEYYINDRSTDDIWRLRVAAISEFCGESFASVQWISGRVRKDIRANCGKNTARTFIIKRSVLPTC